MDGLGEHRPRLGRSMTNNCGVHGSYAWEPTFRVAAYVRRDSTGAVEGFEASKTVGRDLMIYR